MTVEKRENPLVSIAFNIAIPGALFYKLGDWTPLEPLPVLVIAIAFPIIYGLQDLLRRGKYNAISILAFVSLLLTGGFGLMKMEGIWFAVKEAAIPGVIGIAVVVSLWTRYPLVRTLLYNEKVIDVPKVDKMLAALNNKGKFDRLLLNTTLLLAASFVLSAVLNFVLAVVILQSPAGTEEFNKELGKMTALSYPVIVVPCMIVTMFALWLLLSGIKKLTGLKLEDIFKAPPPKK